ncbi:MAG: FadR/GntR family transcriptional regulator [Steroidobacteraceae bacterium]
MSKAPKDAPRTKKLSEIVAAQLMEEIRSRGWPVGESLGTESDLMARFNVSRATMTEAVRQVERYGAAVMRRGSGGGLVVTNSARAALSRTISTYLELSNVTLAEQYEATRLIETEAVSLAAENVTEDQIVALRSAAADVTKSDDNLGLHRAAMQLRLAIAEASGSRSVLLFMRSLVRVLTHYVRPDLRTHYRDREFEHGMAADLSGIVEAIVAGNGALAAHYVRLDVDRREHRAHELAVAQPLLEGGPLRRETPNKLAEKIAYAIRDDIARMGWQTGERLGDEADLPGRYGVSPWVLRQAVRILEPSGIVCVRRGQGGGLYIGRPSPEQTIESATSYLLAYQTSTAVPIDAYVNTRRCIFQEMASSAAKRSTHKEREDLLALTRSQANGDSEDFWALISTLGRNQVLQLFASILNRFIAASSGGQSYCGPSEMRIGIAEAIQGGDAPLAQRRMGNYLHRVAASAAPKSEQSTASPVDPPDPLTGTSAIAEQKRSGSTVA